MTAEGVEAALQEALKDGQAGGEEFPDGIAKWAIEKARFAAKLEAEPSKLGIAREYVNWLRGEDSDSFTRRHLTKSSGLLQKIQNMLSIPELREPDQKVTND